MKRALCVGINNYPGTNSDLSGCVNDAQDWAAELRTRDYDVTILLDSSATLSRITNGLKELLSDAKRGDQLVFTFSGHGSWLPDRDGDDEDTRDEMLCPYDVTNGAYLMDDMISDIFEEKPTGVKLFFISDSCHSGTVSRFALTERRPQEQQTRVRFLPPLNFVRDRELAEIIRQTPHHSRRLIEKYPSVLLAGCRDTEYSYDAWFNRRPNGAFTRVAIDALRRNPSKPVEWMRFIRERLPSNDYPQTPQLYGNARAKGGAML